MTKSRVLIFLLALVPILYLISLKNYFYYWDGVDTAYYLDHPSHRYILHPHHLIFAPFCYAVFTILNYLGYHRSSIHFLVTLNIIAGSFFLFTIYLVFARLFPKFKYGGLYGVYILTASYAFGTYLRNTDQYIIPILLLSLIAFRILRNIRKGIFTVTILDWILFFIAIMFHQMAFFFLPALIYAEFNSGRKGSYMVVVRNLILLLTASSAAYVLAFWISRPDATIQSFNFWFIGYLKNPFWIFSENRGFYNSFRVSLVESFSSHKALFLAPIDRITILRLPQYLEHRHDVLLSNMINNCIYAVLMVFLVMGLFITMFSRNYYTKISLFCLIWILPFLIFLQLFVPFQIFYRLYYILPLVILILATIETLQVKLYSRIFAILFLVSFAAYNYYYGYLPESKPYNNPYLVLSKVIREQSGRNDLFIFPDQDYFYGKYLRYFGNREVAWIRKFPIEDYPDATKEQVRRINSDSLMYSKKYSRIFTPSYTDLKSGPFKIILLSGAEPEYLMVFPDQIHILRKKHFYNRVFYNMAFHDESIEEP